MSLTVLSTGVGYGKVHKIKKNVTTHQPTLDYAAEVNYFLKTKATVYQSLENLKNKSTRDEIIAFQQAILQDQLLENEVKTKIRTKHLSAKDAFSESIKTYIQTLQSIEDSYLKERVIDINDLSERLCDALDEKVRRPVSEPIVLCVDVLYPSYLFEYEPYIQAIIVKDGSSLSHGIILAKERNIPCVMAKDLKYNEGDFLFVDGNNHRIIINPNTNDVVMWKKQALDMYADLEVSHFPNKLYLNVSGETLVDSKFVEASDGIGLYRSEFLYFQYGQFPSVDKQVEVYGKFLKQFYPKPVTIRTYDFGDDKTPQSLGELQRGVSDYFMTYQKEFVEQLSALLVLNETYDNLRIMIPMVKTIHDRVAIIDLMKKLHTKFSFKKPLPKVGVMIETEEAFMYLEQFSTVDFISIGSNDLGKSLLHVDRSVYMDENDYAKKMVKIIEEIDQFAKHYQIPCTICGDIASRPQALSMMLSSHIHNFSIPMTFLRTAKKIIKEQKRRI